MSASHLKYRREMQESQSFPLRECDRLSFFEKKKLSDFVLWLLLL